VGVCTCESSLDELRLRPWLLRCEHPCSVRPALWAQGPPILQGHTEFCDPMSTIQRSSSGPQGRSTSPSVRVGFFDPPSGMRRTKCCNAGAMPRHHPMQQRRPPGPLRQPLAPVLQLWAGQHAPAAVPAAAQGGQQPGGGGASGGTHRCVWAAPPWTMAPLPSPLPHLKHLSLSPGGSTNQRGRCSSSPELACSACLPACHGCVL